MGFVYLLFIAGSTTCTVCTDVLSFVKTLVGAKATQVGVVCQCTGAQYYLMYVYATHW